MTEDKERDIKTVDLSKDWDIICEDNIRAMRRMPDDSIDMIITSPPYDNARNYDSGQNINVKELAKLFYSKLKKGGVAVVIMSDQTINGSESGTSFRWALTMKDAGLRIHDTMIWQKQSASFPAKHNGSRYSQIFEYMFVFSKGKPKTANLICDKANKYAGVHHTKTKFRLGGKEAQNQKYFDVADKSPRTNVWKQSTTDDRGKKFHPATFPLQLIKDHIRTWSNEGDVVLDPFSGSGTSVLAALELHRKGFGMDISDYYVKKSREYVGKQYDDFLHTDHEIDLF